MAISGHCFAHLCQFFINQFLDSLPTVCPSDIRHYAIRNLQRMACQLSLQANWVSRITVSKTNYLRLGIKSWHLIERTSFKKWHVISRLVAGLCFLHEVKKNVYSKVPDL